MRTKSERVAWFVAGCLATTTIMAIGLGPPGVENVGKILRARGFEVWDADARAVRLNVEEEFNKLTKLVDAANARADESLAIANRLYKGSKVEADDTAAARADAKRKQQEEATATSIAAQKQIAKELAQLREELAKAREAANDSARQAELDRWISDSQRQMNDEEAVREIRKIRRALERP